MFASPVADAKWIISNLVEYEKGTWSKVNTEVNHGETEFYSCFIWLDYIYCSKLAIVVVDNTDNTLMNTSRPFIYICGLKLA